MLRKLLTDPPESAVKDIRSRLLAYNLQHIEDKDPHEYVLRYETAAEELVAGICFTIHGQWLDIDYLVVEEEKRTQGIGSQLLQDVEALAMEKGCTMAFLTTFGFQARPFYEKHGYHVVYEQKGYPRSGSKFYMEKQLRLGRKDLAD